MGSIAYPILEDRWLPTPSEPLTGADLQIVRDAVDHAHAKRAIEVVGDGGVKTAVVCVTNRLHDIRAIFIVCKRC